VYVRTVGLIAVLLERRGARIGVELHVTPLPVSSAVGRARMFGIGRELVECGTRGVELERVVVSGGAR